VQHRCNVAAVDAALHWVRNTWMMTGADMPCILPARRTRPRSADPRQGAENAENREKAENGETLKRVKTAKRPNHAPAAPSGALPLPFTGSNRGAVRRWGEGRADAPTDETLKQATPRTARETLKRETSPASRSRAETVKQAPGRRRGIASRTARETVKHPRKIQSGEGVRCFTPMSPAGPPETLSRRCGIAGETLKCLAVPLPGAAIRRAHETVKRLKTLKRVNGENGEFRVSADQGRGRPGPVGAPDPLWCADLSRDAPRYYKALDTISLCPSGRGFSRIFDDFDLSQV